MGVYLIQMDVIVSFTSANLGTIFKNSFCQGFHSIRNVKNIKKMTGKFGLLKNIGNELNYRIVLKELTLIFTNLVYQNTCYENLHFQCMK